MSRSTTKRFINGYTPYTGLTTRFTHGYTPYTKQRGSHTVIPFPVHWVILTTDSIVVFSIRLLGFPDVSIGSGRIVFYGERIGGFPSFPIDNSVHS